MIKILKSMAVTAALATGVMAAPAHAGTIQLGFILDESGSIGSSNYTIIKTGLANAINTLIPIGGANSYEISVVSFGSTAQTLVSHVLLDSIATRAAVAAAVAADTYSGGGTAMDAAFNAMNAALSGSTNAIDFSYVNFATDGVPNSSTAAVTARNALISAGVDNISVEGIGSGVSVSFLQGSICYPQPCDSTSPYNFPTQGFYIPVADATAYAAAIGNKVRVVTQQVPEPASLALLGISMLGLFAARRRNQA